MVNIQYGNIYLWKTLIFISGKPIAQLHCPIADPPFEADELNYMLKGGILSTYVYIDVINLSVSTYKYDRASSKDESIKFRIKFNGRNFSTFFVV